MPVIWRAVAGLVEVALRLRAMVGAPTLRERLMLDAPPLPAQVWIHGASVGELVSARQVIMALAADLPVIVTCNTETARAMVPDWGLPVRLAPLDLPGAVARFLDAVQPRLLITIEGEFWPLRSQELARRGIAQAMIGARISAKSARNWARMPGLMRAILGRMALVSAQDQGSAARLIALGLPPGAAASGLDLKLLTPALILPPADSARRDLTVLAASTHDGDEVRVLDAWQAVRARHPGLRLRLAIRHPQRGDAVAALIAARGLPLARRSAGDQDGDLLLVDVLAEMDRWYADAGICIIAGTFTDRGGHTPWEPAAHCCALLHGPDVANHSSSFQALHDAGAARQVDGATLTPALDALLSDPGTARAMGQAARQVLLARVGDPDALIARLRGLAQTPARADIKAMQHEDGL